MRKPIKPCGTYAAYRRHTERGEEPCEACREAKLEYNRAYRKKRKQAGWEPRKLFPCGTHAAYQRHLRRGEEPCGPCWEANKSFDRKRIGLPYWVVYVRKFSDGMWYYGSTRMRLNRREEKKGGKVGDYIRRRVPHTVEILARCDTKEQALQMEARLILASDRSKLLNGSVPWHFCEDEYQPPWSGVKFHRRRGEQPCEPALKANREAQRKGYAKRKAKRELEAG